MVNVSVPCKVLQRLDSALVSCVVLTAVPREHFGNEPQQEDSHKDRHVS
jgi:hypothetical protein